jgi:hypothetical protein
VYSSDELKRIIDPGDAISYEGSGQSTRVVLDFHKPADSLESNFDQLAPIEPSGLVIDSVNAYGH